VKRVLSLVLAVVLVAAVLAPVAPVNAVGFKDVPASLSASDEINALAAKTGIGGYADAALRWTSGSQLLRTRQQLVASRRRTLMSRTSGLRTFYACILSSASTLTKSARASRATTTCFPLPFTTTGTFSTGIGASSQHDHVCQRHIADG
jgi:hypothetical protein